MNKDERPVMVTIRCITYNHERYIRQCLDGFVMQKTNFRFEIVIHDDASTDRTAEIIREYVNKYPELFVPIFEEENQYNNWDHVVELINAKIRGKYIAMCEGDDYWIDPLKLQKQVDFMESHPDYSMTCNRTKLFSQRRFKFVGENYCYKRSRCVDVKDVILRGGLFISTCSILFRRTIISGVLPDYMKKCHVGDYPLQILAAMKGNVYYFNEAMSVYRVENSNSWIGKRKIISVENRIDTVRSEVDMLEGFSLDYPHFSSFFLQRKIVYINRSIPNRRYPKSNQTKYLIAFKDELKDYSFIARIDLWMRCLRLKGISILCPFNLSGKYVGKTNS